MTLPTRLAGPAMLFIKGKALLLAAIWLLSAPPLFAQQGETEAGPPALEAAIAQSHVALDAILNGDHSLYLALFADSDDITLGNPFGPFGEGRDAVAATLANAASKYQRGKARVERVALYADQNFATLVEIEHDRAQLTGSEDFSEFSVRVTSLYRRFGSKWRLVHRHADPITSMRAAQPDALTDFARSYADAWSSQKPEAVAAFYTEDGRLVVNGGEPAVGRAAITDVARGFMEAFPDMVVAFDRLEPSGERMLFHWTLTGTNTGPGGSGAPVRISGLEAWLVGPKGLVADSIGTFDAKDYARQLAAPPSSMRPKSDSESEAAKQLIQQTIDTVYAAISGPAGSPREWTVFRSAFSEDARLFTITAEGLQGGSVEDYIARSSEALVAYGFSEEELVNRIEVYGDLAQAWSSYQGHFVRDGEPGRIRGINSFQLRRQADGSWRVHSLLWQQETSEFPLPNDMANAARPLVALGGHVDLTQILDNRTRVILEGIRSGDVSAIMALYGPGSLYSTDNTTMLSDLEAIKAFWVNLAASPAHDANLEVLRIERLGPDAFVEIQKYDVFDAAGERMFGGYASLLWRKVGGRWIIAADVSN